MPTPGFDADGKSLDPDDPDGRDLAHPDYGTVWPWNQYKNRWLRAHPQSEEGTSGPSSPA